MAKLEDLITPSQILELIRGGMLKTELIKRYKTSEQELAMVLVPLYRGGELTKEEFNNFFQGLSLAPNETPVAEAPEAARTQEPVDRPGEIIRSLQKFIGKKTSANSAEPEESPIEDAHEEVAAQDIVPAQDIAPAQDVELEVEETVDLGPETDVEEEPTSVPETLQAILKKLDSIDDRLSGIEKKLGLD